MEKIRNNDALKRLAQQAKKRLTKGAYQETQKYASKFKVYEGGIVADYKIVVQSDSEDEKLYNKVCALLKENIDIIDPLGQIIDKEKLNSLSSLEKDRYILSLRDKYLEMKNRFLKECNCN